MSYFGAKINWTVSEEERGRLRTCANGWMVVALMKQCRSVRGTFGNIQTLLCMEDPSMQVGVSSWQ